MAETLSSIWQRQNEIKDKIQNKIKKYDSTYSEEDYQNFESNLVRYYNDGVITKEEADMLLESINWDCNLML